MHVKVLSPKFSRTDKLQTHKTIISFIAPVRSLVLTIILILQAAINIVPW